MARRLWLSPARQSVLLHDARKAERVTEEEVMASLRLQGASALGDVHAVVLETGGDMSVIKSEPESDGSVLRRLQTKQAHTKP